jgi:outer membrane protein TolC
MTFQVRIVASALALVGSCTFTPAHAGAPLHESAGVLMVCRDTPNAALARAERIRGEAEVSAAAVSPNPALVASHQRALNGPTDAETIVGLSVPIRVSGRRSLLQDAARARREQAQADAHATLFESALAFREAYVTAMIDEAKLDVAERQQAVLLRLNATMTGLASRGEAAGYDILRQELLSKVHRRAVESLRAQAARSRALLSAWTGGEVALPKLSLDLLAGGHRTNDGEAPMASPRARSLALAARAATLDARAARRRWVPDLDLFAGYRATDLESDTGHGIALEITVPMTFFDHGQGEAARAEADAALAEARLNVLRREHRAELRSASAEIAILEPGVQDAEAAVRETLELRGRAEQLYAAGEASITELLQAFQSVEEAELGLIALREQIAHARLALMRARGSLLDPNLDQRCGAPSRGAR